MKRILMLLLLFCAGAAVAQAPPPSGLATRDVRVTVKDQHGHPFDTGKVNVGLADATGHTPNQVIEAGGTSFTVGDEDGKPYPVKDGAADVRLIVSSDDSADFRYRFTVKGNDGHQYVSRAISISSATRTVPLVITTYTFHPPVETACIAIAGFVALVMVILTFFFWAFRRLLFNNRMEVHSASSITWILTLVYLLIIVCCLAAAYLQFWITMQYLQYDLGVVAVFLGFYLIGTLLLWIFSRPKAERSEA